MRIVFFENNPAYFLSHRLNLAQALRAEGHVIHVLAMPGQAARTIEAAGFIFHPVPLKRGSFNPFTEFRTLIWLYRFYRGLRPDLVYQVTIKPVIYGTLAARFARVRLLVNVISGLGYFALQKGIGGNLLRQFVFFLYWVSLRHPHQKIIFHNDDDRMLFANRKIVALNQSTVVPGSGVDVEHYTLLNEPPGVPVVVLPARMLRDKGVGEFVAAATILKIAGVQAKFILAGDTDPENPSAIAESVLHQWNKEGNIEWIGHELNMRKIYAVCHIVCLPSYREGLARVLIEAAACGRAVVTTDVPGCRDAIVSDETGLLVPPHDAQLLADALQKLILNGTLRHQMGHKGRRYVVERFSIARIIVLTLEIISQLEKTSV